MLTMLFRGIVSELNIIILSFIMTMEQIVIALVRNENQSKYLLVSKWLLKSLFASLSKLYNIYWIY